MVSYQKKDFLNKALECPQIDFFEVSIHKSLQIIKLVRNDGLIIPRAYSKNTRAKCDHYVDYKYTNEGKETIRIDKFM